MAKQGEQLQQQIEKNGGTGEISYPADDEKEYCTTMSQRGPRERKKLNIGITDMNRTSGFAKETR